MTVTGFDCNCEAIATGIAVIVIMAILAVLISEDVFFRLNANHLRLHASVN